MRKSKQFLGMPVVSLEEGQQIGAVKGLVVDPAKKMLVALIVEQRGWFKEQKFIPYAKVRSVGDDAITIDRNANVQKSASLPEIVHLLKEKFEIIGSRIVAENGTVLGNVDEYYVALESGEIVGLEFSLNFLSSVMTGRAFLDINYIRTIGKRVIICADNALDNFIKMDGGLHETVRNIRNSSGQIWDSTMQKTRSFGFSMNKYLDKIKKDRADEDSLRIMPADNGESAGPDQGEQGQGYSGEPPAGDAETTANAAPPADDGNSITPEEENRDAGPAETGDGPVMTEEAAGTGDETGESPPPDPKV